MNAIDYVEKARDDFEADAKVNLGTPEGEAFATAAQRMSAILDRLRQDEARQPGSTETVVEEANKLIRGDRLEHYGHPSVNFKRIADSWSAFLGVEVTPVMVAIMMILLKAQRVAEGYHHDSMVDIIGYAALAAILEGDDTL